MDKERIDGFRILRVGAGYFRIVAFSYLPMAVSTVLSAWLQLQGTRRCPLLGKFWRGSGEHQAERSAYLRKAGCPRYGRYRCCHRHAGFSAFEPAFDLDRLCGLPSKGSGTPAHRGDLDWRFGHGGRAFYVYFPSTTESLISFSVSLRSRAPPSATVTRSS